MDYEKAYKEAHSRAEMFRDTIYGGIAEEIFPDLRESSYDEKIRKELIEMVKEDWPGRSDVVDWLEKQGDQKQEWSEEDESRINTICTYLQDYARLSGSESRTIRINEYCDWLKSLKDRVQPKQEWSEKDEERIEQICDDLKCGLENFRSGKNVKGLHFEEIIKSNINWLKSLKDRVQPKQEWSEEDKKISRFIGNAITADGASEYLGSKGIQVIDAHVWLEGLKDRVQPKQEWSEEDKYYYDIIQYILNNECVGKTDKENAINWLKSLRPNHWKPIEERMEAPQKVRIYISGPISGYDLEERRKAFMEIEERLKAQGYETVNPMKNGLPDEATTHEHMKRDIELLLTCDRIYFMKKWTHSKGCKVEFDVATAIGLPVMFEEAIELTEFCKMITFE